MQGPAKTTVDLGPQLITNPQWPNPFVKKVFISVARTETQIAVRLEWQDDSVSNGIGQSRLYTDQAAIMFPLNSNKEVPPITMGGEGFPVNIWQWKAVRQVTADSAARDLASPISPVEDLNAEGFSTLTRQDEQNVSGKGLHTGKGWQVVFKRNLTNADEHDVQFAGSTPMAVAIDVTASPWLYVTTGGRRRYREQLVDERTAVFAQYRTLLGCRVSGQAHLGITASQHDE